MLLNISCSKAQPKTFDFPKFETVVESYYKNYGGSTYESVNFEKRPEGWYVVKRKGEIEDKILFWDSKERGFKKLDIVEGNKYNIAQYTKRHYTYANMQYYDLHPFYGYPGYFLDVIEHYSQVKEMNDTASYSLGKAYDHYANNLLTGSWGMRSRKLSYNLPIGKNTMTEKQVKEYNSYQDKVVEQFKKVINLNPHFRVIVGSIKTKLANTYMSNYLDLLVHQNEKEALKRIESKIYDQYWIDIAKNYLNSCDSNAILITHGDNDTYPLLYVQAKLNYRKDIQIINYSLLSNQVYFYHILDFSQKQMPIKSGFKINQLKDTIRYTSKVTPKPQEYIYLNSQGAEKIDASKVHEITEGDKLSKDIIIPYSSNKSINIEAASSYLIKSDIFLLDILGNNYSERAVFFSANYISGPLREMSNYLEDYGLVSKLNFNEKKPKFNLNQNYNNLIENFSYEGFSKLDKNDRNIIRSIRSNLINLGEEYLNNEKRDSALIVLDFCDKTIPNQISRYSNLGYYMANLYLRLDEKEKAQTILDKTLKNIELGSLIFEDDWHPHKKGKSREILLEAIADLSERFELHDIQKKSLELVGYK